VVPVEFEGPAAHVLRGLLFGAGEHWAILVHGEGHDLDAWRPLTAWLAERGLCALAFDLPGHGASDDAWDPALATASVLAAVDFARSQGARMLHLIGAEAGAIAVLAAGARDGYEPASIVVLSPTIDERVASLAGIREARAAKLVLVGSLDGDAVGDAEVVYRAAIGYCELTKFPVSARGTGLLTGDWGSHAREKVLAHITGKG
jgi:alpha-beta hydrolase superfamily lysophospholipase